MGRDESFNQNNAMQSLAMPLRSKLPRSCEKTVASKKANDLTVAGKKFLCLGCAEYNHSYIFTYLFSNNTIRCDFSMNMNGRGSTMRKAFKKSVILLCTIWMIVYGAQIGYGAQVASTPGEPPNQETEEMHEEAGRGRPGQEAKVNKLAVIIDDFGNDQKGTQEILSLPVKITVAVMPFLPTSVKDAEAAHRQGHDVIIHMPMEPKQGRSSWLGPGAILSSLTDEEIRERMEEAIDSVPYAVGINNHMGSKVTGDERVMSIVLDVCRERGLFFIDSKTNYHSVIGKLAAEKGMPSIANDIFLDDVHTVQHVSKQLLTAVQHAEERTSCIAIGHVGKYGIRTAEALKGTIPKLQTKVEFVGISDLVRERSSWRPNPLPAN